MSPASGAANDTVTLVGSNFATASIVHFDAALPIPLTPGTGQGHFQIVSDTQITFPVPNAAPLGPNNVYVTNSAGDSNAQTYLVTTSPVNQPSATITPNTGNIGTTVEAVIRGTLTHFYAGGTTVITAPGALGVTIEVKNIVSTTEIRVILYIAGNADDGDRNIMIDTDLGALGHEIVTRTPSGTLLAFTVTSDRWRIRSGLDGMLYPNPFDPNDEDHPLHIWINQDTGEAISLYIFDASGRIVWEYKKPLPDDQTVLWDGESAFGETVDNGIYLVRCVVGSSVVYKDKLLVIKKK